MKNRKSNCLYLGQDYKYLSNIAHMKNIDHAVGCQKMVLHPNHANTYCTIPNSENTPFFPVCKAKICLGDCKLQIFKTAV